MKRAISCRWLRSPLFAVVVLVPLVLGTSLSARAQATNQTKYPSVITLGPANPKPMTVNDVIKLSKAGLSDDTIIQQLRKKGQHFDLTTDQLIQLKQAHVSERVIQEMINPAPGAAAASAQKSTPSSGQADASRSGLPTEIGVYAKQDGRWVEVNPEVVYWNTPGLMKSMASAAIGKGDLSGRVDGTTSQNQIATPADFLLVIPEGAAITQYQLIKLRPQNDDREFRTGSDGVLHGSSAANRDLLPFAGTQVAPRTFTGRFIGQSGSEYGFLPPSAFTSNGGASGKIYSFHMTE